MTDTPAGPDQSRALRCLIEAVRQIEAAQPLVTRGDVKTLRLPVYPPPAAKP